MSEYLIQGETLANIARQTNSLVGKSDRITPHTMIENLSYANEEVTTQHVMLTDWLNSLYSQNPGGFLAMLIDRTPMTISLDTATAIGSSVFRFCTSLTSISFPQATTIGDYAFQHCSNLTTMSFPQVSTIGYYAFGDCTNLTSVDFPQVTTIGDYAFYNCTSLASVDFPQATTIDYYAFWKCTNLTSISFPQVTTISGYAFEGCINLTTVSFPQATTIGYATFYKCAKLTSIYLTGSSLCTLDNTYAFDITGITRTTGSIFVPASLVAAYQSATNWAYFSSRIFAFENYPEANGGV